MLIAWITPSTPQTSESLCGASHARNRSRIFRAEFTSLSIRIPQQGHLSTTPGIPLPYPKGVGGG